MSTNLLTGRVQQGGTTNQIALGGVPVTVYEATTRKPNPVGSATTLSNGTFSLTPSITSSDSIFYALASVGEGVTLATIIGPSIPASITINELTTVAAAFAFVQFFHEGVIAGNAFGLGIAAGMNNNLVSPLTGESSQVLLSPPNGDETNSLRSTRSLANLLSVCVLIASTENVDRLQQSAIALFTAATPLDGTRPTDTFQALVNIARNPANNVTSIYAQSRDMDVELYRPSLERMPDAWTIAVKINDTGSETALFGGPGNIAFDDKGYAWITNNVFQGTPGSSNFMVILQPNGKPSDGTNGTPKSPITGGGLKGGGFGVTIDPDGNIWEGNFGWGRDNPAPEPPGSGSVSKFNAAGTTLSNPDGYYGGTDRVQSLVSDQDGNIWIASFGNDRVVVFPKGEHHNSFWFPPNSNQPAPTPVGQFGIAIAVDGSAWVTNSGGLTVSSKSSISKYVIENGELVQLFIKELGHSLKGLSLDSKGNAWVASGGDNAVYLLNPNGDLLGKFNGGGVNCPWSVTVDGDDHVWVANFGPMRPGMDYTTSSISKLAGTNPSTLPPRLKTGDPISPPTGYTLPSAGAEVRLANGDPLYGAGQPKSHSPLMRITNCCIDQAGNVWALNNWKPNFNADVAGNPGGDGIVIFVGLARPPKT